MESAISTVLILVGDLFAAFADQDDVCTTTRFIADLEAGAFHRYTSPLHIVRGQGIDEVTWQRIAAKLALIPPGILITHCDDSVVPVQRELVHKTHDENVLIGDLTRTGELTYTAGLRIDAANELLLDHTSGQHVQGMVTIEACRQLMLAGVLSDHSPATESSFLLRSLDIEFARYLYPVAAELRLTLEPTGKPRRGRAEFTGVVEVFQAGEFVACCRSTFSVLNRQVLARIENAAAATVAQYVATHRRPARQVTAPVIPAQPMPVPALALSEV